MLDRQNEWLKYRRAGKSAQAAAQLAGYRDYRNAAKRNEKLFCEQTGKEEADRCMAQRSEIIEFWTDILRDEDMELKDRLKVSEFLAKALGAFERSDEEACGEPVCKMSLAEKFELIESIRRSAS